MDYLEVKYSQQMNTTDFLIVVDFSYWLHSAASGAVALFTYEHPDEAKKWIKPPE